MELNFRSKEQGWYESGIKENTFFTPQKENPYMNLFLRDLCLRPSCYKCVQKRKTIRYHIGRFMGSSSGSI